MTTVYPDKHHSVDVVDSEVDTLSKLMFANFDSMGFDNPWDEVWNSVEDCKSDILMSIDVIAYAYCHGCLYTGSENQDSNALARARLLADPVTEMDFAMELFEIQGFQYNEKHYDAMIGSTVDAILAELDDYQANNLIVNKKGDDDDK